MWVWVAIGVGIWLALSVIAAFALGRVFGDVRHRVALQRMDFLEAQWWADRALTRAKKHAKERREASANAAHPPQPPASR